jgi:hypothetical protein
MLDDCCRQIRRVSANRGRVLPRAVFRSTCRVCFSHEARLGQEQPSDKVGRIADNLVHLYIADVLDDIDLSTSTYGG